MSDLIGGLPSRLALRVDVGAEQDDQRTAHQELVLPLDQLTSCLTASQMSDFSSLRPFSGMTHVHSLGLAMRAAVVPLSETSGSADQMASGDERADREGLRRSAARAGEARARKDQLLLSVAVGVQGVPNDAAHLSAIPLDKLQAELSPKAASLLPGMHPMSVRTVAGQLWIVLVLMRGELAGPVNLTLPHPLRPV